MYNYIVRWRNKNINIYKNHTIFPFTSPRHPNWVFFSIQSHTQFPAFPPSFVVCNWFVINLIQIFYDFHTKCSILRGVHRLIM